MSSPCSAPRVAIADGPATHHKHSQQTHLGEMMALKQMIHNQPRSCATACSGSMEHPCQAQRFHYFHHVCLLVCLPERMRSWLHIISVVLQHTIVCCRLHCTDTSDLHCTDTSDLPRLVATNRQPGSSLRQADAYTSLL